MKIAFVGTECTGKTTLSKQLAEKLGVMHIPDPYAQAMNSAQLYQYPDCWNPSSPVNWVFDNAMHEAQYKLEYGVENFVADSASIVRAACTLFYCSLGAPEQDVSDIVGRALDHAVVYDWLIYLPPTVLYIDNGHRVMNRNVRRSIDLIIRGLLEKLPLHQHIVSMDPLVTSLDAIIGYAFR